MSTIKRKRCENGTRKNKKTGKCESVLDNTCPICLDRITSKNVKTKCKHNFHKGCLLGYCNSQQSITRVPHCPICRSNITDTCKKITPFASNEIFRYTTIVGATEQQRVYRLQKIDEIIHNPKFDINVKTQYGKSLLYELSWNKYQNAYFKDFVEYLLKKPKIIVSSQLITSLIGINNTDMLALYKKYKKIPKSLKGLV